MRKFLLVTLSAFCLTTAFAQQTTSMGFLFFNGKPAGTKAELVWETIQELTVSKFNVQRSTDGDHFTTISQFAAKGDTSSTVKCKYSFTDPFVANTETVFYRLECLDVNGNPYYSKVLPIQFKRSKNMVILSSNKVSQTLWLDVTISEKRRTSFIITNTSGNIVSQQSVSCEKGMLRKDIDVSHLPAGTYTVLVSNGSETQFARFLKQ